MIFNLNLLHLLLIFGVASCILLALREISGRSMTLLRLFMLPLLAMGMALVFLLFYLASRNPPWMFGAALLFGFLAGGVRRCDAMLTVAFSSLSRRIQIAVVKGTAGSRFRLRRDDAASVGDQRGR